jgi:hypothetical protein
MSEGLSVENAVVCPACGKRGKFVTTYSPDITKEEVVRHLIAPFTLRTVCPSCEEAES